MSGVRVLVGTRKGMFVLTSDGTRDQWDIGGPLFGGWEIFHVKGSPADPNRIYASQHTGWFGQQIQRSNDAGKNWEPVGNKFEYEGIAGTHYPQGVALGCYPGAPSARGTWAVSPTQLPAWVERCRRVPQHTARRSEAKTR